MTVDPVPDADLHEQQEPEPDVRPPHVSRPDEPEADVLEQEQPVDAEDEGDEEDEHRRVGEETDWRERYPE
jgi:hypothetical protein